MPNKTQQEQKDERQIDLVDSPPERREAPRSEVIGPGECHVAAQQTRQLAAVTPADLLQIAVQGGADIEKLEKLMELQMRWESDQARKAFADAMASFKATPISIGKDGHVDYTNKDGKRTVYDHATIGNVVSIIVPALAEFGFSHRWDTHQSDGLVTVDCVITHRMGHSQSTRMSAAPDASGGKNGIQSIASTKTYLERYTLLAATGLATKDQADDDGQKAELDTSLADKWLMKADAAKTLPELEKAWTEGVAELSAANDLHGYNELKAKVTARKKDFPEVAK